MNGSICAFIKVSFYTKAREDLKLTKESCRISNETNEERQPL